MTTVSESDLKVFFRGVADGTFGSDDPATWTIPEQPASALIDDIRAFLQQKGVYGTMAADAAAGGLLAETGDFMTDDAFLAYCEAMTHTPRCGFVPAHMARLCRLAGEEDQAERFDRERGPIVDHRHDLVRSLVRLARRREMPDLQLASRGL